MTKTKFIQVTTISLILAGGLIVSQCNKKAEDSAGDETSETTDSAATDAGKALYTSNGCASCHGDTGLGDGPAGAALNPKPRDLSAKDSYKQGSSQAEIAQSIAKGVPGTTMVAYSNISEEDRNKIAAFIVSLHK